MSGGQTKVVIVGAGIYGMSTALWMLEDGAYDVTILDRSETLPAPDAASTDLNKIIRSADYADPDLAGLALQAVEMWRKPEWEGTYHESGVMCLSSKSNPESHAFVFAAYSNCRALGLQSDLTPTLEKIQEVLGDIPIGDFGGREGYINYVGGWAEAERATKIGLDMVRARGGVIRGGCEVVGLERTGRTVSGVKLKSGEIVPADIVVVAAGAWTPSLFALPGMEAKLPPAMATGQCLATIQLTPEEAKKYGKTPVVLSLDDGFYLFPPNPDGLIKLAYHNAGYLNPQPVAEGSTDVQGVSIPRTKLTPGAEDGAIPKEMVVALRQGLRGIYPELAEKDFVSTRLCWYCDTVTDDWIIDYHPEYDNLVVASGDSGHGFKFAPIIGREILKVVQRQPPPEYAERWAFKERKADPFAEMRQGTVKVLKLHELATKEDLKSGM